MSQSLTARLHAVRLNLAVRTAPVVARCVSHRIVYRTHQRSLARVSALASLHRKRRSRTRTVLTIERVETHFVRAERHCSILFQSERRVVNLHFAPSRCRRSIAPSLSAHATDEVSILKKERHVERSIDVDKHLAEQLARSLSDACHRSTAVSVSRQSLVERILVHLSLASAHQSLIDSIHSLLSLVNHISVVCHVALLDESPLSLSRAPSESQMTAVSPRHVQRLAKLSVSKRVDILSVLLRISEVSVRRLVHHHIVLLVRSAREIVAAALLLVSDTKLAVAHEHIALLRRRSLHVTVCKASGANLRIARHAIHSKGVSLHVIHIHHVRRLQLLQAFARHLRSRPRLRLCHEESPRQKPQNKSKSSHNI